MPPSLEFQQQRQSEQDQGKLEHAEVHGRFLPGAVLAKKAGFGTGGKRR
jgi:hypothetical protein